MSSKTKTTSAKEEGKTALVPKLRFPEFRGMEGWSDEALSDVATIVMGSSPKSECYNHCEIGLPLLQGNADIKNRLSAPRIFTSEVTKECTVGDILLSVRAPVGSVAKSVHHACIGRGIAAIHSKRPNSQEFLYQWLLSYEPRWVNISQGGTFDAINSDDLKQVGLAVPSPSEQQKIAECLSSVDELMAAQARKVDALKTHKKGLMQQLFPREGETQPRLRFPEFQKGAEWVQKTVGGVSDVLMCKRIFAEETNPSEGIPFYKIGTLGGVPDAFISREKFEDYKSRYNYPRKDEVLITCSGTVGKCLPFDGKDAYFQDSNIVWLDNPTGEVSNKFLLMLLSNVNWGSLNSTTITRIYGPDLRGLAIKYPEDEAEQQRIASCLSSLDALITAETQKHEALKTHKKGLMQQLFPSPEEVEA